MYERRAFGLEVRAEGRKLSGTVMRFGDVSPSHRERFEPGSIRFAAAVHLDLYHDVERVVAWHPGGGMKLSQTAQALTLRADLPPIPAADRALSEVRAGHTTGLSVEFQAKRERRESGLRVIEAAELRGIGLVKSPSYHQSQVEARRRSGRRMRSYVPYDTALACDCIAQGGSSGAACVAIAKFQKVAGAEMEAMMTRAFAAAERDVLAVAGNFRRPLASVSKGTLRGRNTDAGFEVEIDLPAGAVGEEIIAANETAGVIVRPLIDFEQSEFVDTAAGREYSKPHVRAFLVGATDTKKGWPEAEIFDDEIPPANRRHEKPRRRLWL